MQAAQSFPAEHTRAAEVLAELTRRRADLVDHGRGSLERHLVGVHALLRHWRQPERVQLAALLHSAYTTESFRHQMFRRDERPRMRELIGVDAERLVWAFCACPQDALLSAASGGAPASVEGRWQGVAVRLERRDLGDLLLLHAANLAEQAASKTGSPSPWLAHVSRLLFLATPCLDAPPPVLGGGTVEVSDAEESLLLRTYRALLAGRPAAGGSIDSPVGEPLVIAAARALAEGRGRDAVALGTRAVAALDAWGVAWDKRLGLPRWRELAELVVREGHGVGEELAAAKRRMQRALDGAGRSPARLWAALDGSGPHGSSGVPPAKLARSPGLVRGAAPLSRGSSLGLPSRFATYIQGLRTNAERPLLQFYPGLRVQPWHDPQLFPIVRDLERSAPDIAREARAFDLTRFQDEAENIDRTGRWGVLFLLEMGRRNEENLARCPSLRSILERHRTLTTHAGLMYFSCLDPHTHVTPHRGPTNVRLRCHLGLDIPRGCGIRVGGVTREWEEGKCLVLDDSFLHDVWNDSDRRRLVLVLDLWHPDLEEDEVALLAGLHRYGAANASGTKRYWANNDQALRRAREGRKDEGSTTALGNEISAALRSGELERAGDVASRYAAACRGTRFYPVRREDDPALPPEVSWPRTLTPAKLTHDIEQLEYLRDHGVLTSELPPIIRRYAELRDRLRPLGDEARVPLNGVAEAQVGHVYNRLIHVRDTPRVSHALAPEWSPAAVENEYLTGKPNVVVVDGFLSPEAAESLRLFCLESTVWSTHRYDHGRLGSFFRDGFSCPLLTQIAEELRSALPRVIGTRHPVTQIWGYKYASVQPALAPHADFAAVNVNFWLTPDDANLEPESGGLVLYHVAAPKDWDFATYNRDGARINELLASTKATPTYIPYRYNRAVIFDSDLFHATPALRFRSGYENRRVNVTVLFGDRLRA